MNAVGHPLEVSQTTHVSARTKEHGKVDTMDDRLDDLPNS